MIDRVGNSNWSETPLLKNTRTSVNLCRYVIPRWNQIVPHLSFKSLDLALFMNLSCIFLLLVTIDVHEKRVFRVSLGEYSHPVVGLRKILPFVL